MIHTFLRSIGFRDLTKNAELYPVLESILNRPDEQTIVTDETGIFLTPLLRSPSAHR